MGVRLIMSANLRARLIGAWLLCSKFEKVFCLFLEENWVMHMQ